MCAISKVLFSVPRRPVAETYKPILVRLLSFLDDADYENDNEFTIECLDQLTGADFLRWFNHWCWKWRSSRWRCIYWSSCPTTAVGIAFTGSCTNSWSVWYTAAHERAGWTIQTPIFDFECKSAATCEGSCTCGEPKPWRQPATKQSSYTTWTCAGRGTEPNPSRSFHSLAEYQVGIGGRKAARLFTPAERGRVKHKYTRRKVVWDTVSRLVRGGLQSDTAIDQIYNVYGRENSVTAIINAMLTDRKNNTIPAVLQKFNSYFLS